MTRQLFFFALIFFLFLTFDAAFSGVQNPFSDKSLYQTAQSSLLKAARFYHSINIRGGYVYNYTVDMKEKWGEGRTDDQTIEVQPPGTPAVGMSFLTAFRATGEKEFLDFARDAAFALIHGQNELGGWDHKIHFDGPKSRVVSFDDDQTQSAIRFLMSLDQEIDDDSLTLAIDKALQMMLKSQLEDGGWPHKYPAQGNYHDYATYNDGGINDCIKVMINAHHYYGKAEYMNSLRKAAHYLVISQLPPPQPGWAQQYNKYLQPAWARTFEPPAVCPLVTIRNINTLIDLYLYIGRSEYLQPIPDALQWLKDVQLPSGKWARFVELYTNKPLYYDRGRIRVNNTSELSTERRTGYGYEQDLSQSLQQAEQRFERIKALGRDQFLQEQNRALSKQEISAKIKALEPIVQKITASQDELGRWITKNERYKKNVIGALWNGEYVVKDRISSAVFNKNVGILCEFIKLCNSFNGGGK